MAKTKFAVVANCQARPVAMLVELMQPDWECAGLVVVHLAKADEERDHIETLRGADIIFAQLVADNYPVPHLATSRLVREFGDRVISWPNLFFHGQTPDCFYLAGAKGRIKGPLDDYHSRIVFEAWRAGRSAAETIDAFASPDADGASDAAQHAERSLAELAQREAGADIKIADHIAGHWRDVPLFHVFNHPASILLIECAARLLADCGAEPLARPNPHIAGEPLGRYVPPMPPAHARALGLAYPTSTLARGQETEIGADGTVRLGKPKIWPLADYVETCFAVYDRCAEDLAAPVFTPALEPPRSVPA